MPELAEVFRLYGPAYLKKHGATMLPSHRRALRDIVDCRTPALGGHYELGPLIRSNQRDLYGLLLTAAPQALVKLAADRRHLGGSVGVMALLHTWSATLDYHPHVHCLVPAGALDKADGSWRPARPNFLVPVRALSKLFKGIFGEMLRQRRPDLVTAPECWRKPWKDHRANSWRTMSLQAEEFIRRFLQHVLPAGLHKIRYVGLWSAPNRLLLRRLRLLLAAPQQSPSPSLPPDSRETSPSNLDGRTCPACHRGTLHLLGTLQAQRARPP